MTETESAQGVTIKDVFGDGNRIFFRLHHEQNLKLNPILHVYAEPNNACATDKRILKWFSKVRIQRELERIPFRTYAHPQAGLGHWDIVLLEKDVWKTTLSDLKQGDIYPAILYCWDRTWLTVAAGVKAIDSKEIVLWTFSPSPCHTEDEDPIKDYLELLDNNFDCHKV